MTEQVADRARRRTWAATVLVGSLLIGGCTTDSLGVGAPSATAGPATGSSIGSSSPVTPGTVAPGTTAPDRLPASGVLLSTTGVLLPIRARLADGGWVVGTPCADEAVVASGTLVSPAHVVLDPGHGGLVESGTIGPNGLREADLNLDVALRTEQWLQSQGVTVLLTRRTDRQVELDARAELATSLAPAAFVSIHHNGGPVGPSARPGTLTFHQAQSSASRRLAGLLYEYVSTALTPLGIDWTAGAPPGAMTVLDETGNDYYAVLRETPGVASAIVEAMYLTNADEAVALNRPEIRQLEAEAIGGAILRYLSSGAGGSGYQPGQVFGSDAVPDFEPVSCTDPPLARAAG